MRFLISFLSVMSILVFIFMAFSYVSNGNSVIVNDVAFILVSFCAALSLFLVSFKIRFKDERLVWILLAIGSFFSFFAEVVWGYNEVILQVLTPSPGLVDFLWIVGEAIVLFAILFQIKNTFGHNCLNFCNVAGWVLGSVIFSLTIGIFLIMNDFSAAMAVSLVHVFIASLVFVGAIFLILPLIRIWNFLVLPWIFLCVSYFLFALEAIIFAYESEVSGFYTGSFIDFVYVAGYVFLCFAAWSKSSQVKKRDGS